MYPIDDHTSKIHGYKYNTSETVCSANKRVELGTLVGYLFWVPIIVGLLRVLVAIPASTQRLTVVFIFQHKMCIVRISGHLGAGHCCYGTA